MNFRSATDELLASITQEDLARAMGVSIQSVRQARTAEESNAYRSPPPGWEIAVKTLALRQAKALQELANHLK